MSVSPSPTFQVASVPLISLRGNASQNVANVSAWLADAALKGISLVVFPEASLVGYGDTLHLRRRELATLAEPLDGRSIEAVANAVERTGVAAGVGFIERAPDGKFFNSYVVCIPGGLRRCHRKLHVVEHPGIECGEQYTVLDTKWGVRIGILIGADNYLIENVRMTALMGATLLVAPHRMIGSDGQGDTSLQRFFPERRSRPRADHGAVTAESAGGADWLRRSLMARASDNGMFVVFSDGSDTGDNQSSPGNGMIIDPWGRVLAESASSSSSSAMVSAAVDPGLIAGSVGQKCLAARRSDVYGPISRPMLEPSDAFEERRSTASRGSIAMSFAQVSRARGI
ncbi:carbon-nitrogen hydrolase [Caballeronia sp. SEWSISQ10-4 2]|uniref:nitrilase-related carbon-nitrogen hydrolase n=1 Tax=Caballeronia sp. SEWSISQ10-4 2 TaxID=2937438 RepID=UPI00265158E1|nr:nitrilase-related carbon-nitrogen hydrolase [Caballeronia sp. SEWSISQ10-4 2]MDN7182689.1 carbon-nitrogen hydrolase [Caballeronia sp. SEWSISQ10-4 2]